MDEAISVADRPLTATDMRTQVNLIQQVMKSVMQEDTHWGKIPGCGNKPVLLKAGAEKLMSVFRLAVEPIVEEIPTEDGLTFRVTCRITNQATGVFLGAGIGEASTKEEKYCWRAAVCDEEFEETDADKRRIKWSKGFQGSNPRQTKQVRTNPSDQANTVLKTAKKRALVDGVLTVTGASDIFTQDEDMTDMGGGAEKGGGRPDPKATVKKKDNPITSPARDSTLTAAQALKKELGEYCGGDTAMGTALLKELSLFTGKDGKEVWMRNPDKSADKWCGTVLGKLREHIEKNPPGEQGAQGERVVPKDCTSDDKTCDHSLYDEEAKPICTAKGNEGPCQKAEDVEF